MELKMSRKVDWKIDELIIINSGRIRLTFKDKPKTSYVDIVSIGKNDMEFESHEENVTITVEPVSEKDWVGHA
jgi:hypothetical protein